MKEKTIYRTASGLIFRVSEGGDDHLAVETLKDNVWTPAKIGIVGLRVAETTVRLTARQVLALPS